MDIATPSKVALLDASKFRDPLITAGGETRASVSLRALQTLLGKMEGVALSAGRELTDASLRQMIRRQKTKA